ncbi:hypothetical protein [Rhizobium sp. SYY.PMSO]|uniref:hypothetical protein n=1 Tax=Rhizobium sp. SYY.PMSO TaxID=3382192 RepID=UPI0039902D3A
MQDTLTDAWFHRLKAANRLLIKKNGGIEESARITSLSKSQIGRCHNDTDTELLPLTAFMRLEAECGDYAVTRAQAEIHGCKLSDPRERAIDAQCLMRENAELTRRTADYQSNAAVAFADFKLTRNESKQAINDLERIKEKADDLINAHSAIIAAGGATVAPLRVVGEE